MARKPEPLSDHAVDAFETELVQAFRRAATTHDLRPVIELADFLVASGTTTRSRGGLLGLFWFQTEMIYGLRCTRHSPSPYALLGPQLVDEGWCTNRDIENGISEYLFRLGTRKGSLPDILYDLMVENGKHRETFQQALEAVHIRRVKTSSP